MLQRKIDLHRKEVDRRRIVLSCWSRFLWPEGRKVVIKMGGHASPELVNVRVNQGSPPKDVALAAQPREDREYHAVEHLASLPELGELY